MQEHRDQSSSFSTTYPHHEDNGTSSVLSYPGNEASLLLESFIDQEAQGFNEYSFNVSFVDSPAPHGSANLTVDHYLCTGHSLNSGKSQPQAVTKAANETTGGHYLVDLEDNDVYPFLREICFRSNGNGTFSCCLSKCPVAWRGPFSTIQEMDQHIRDMIQDRRFVCGLCKENFKNKTDCKRHVNSKNRPNRFPCPVQGCGKKSARMDALKQHVLTCHKAYHWQRFTESGV